MFQTKFVEEVKTHILCLFFFFDNRTVYEIRKLRYSRAREGTDDSITRWMLFACWITKATNTHSEYACNNYCSSTATTVARTRLNVTLYVQCLSCLILHIMVGNHYALKCWSMALASGEGRMQNEAGWIICVLRYNPNIWRYDAEWSGVPYFQVPSKYSVVPITIKRSALYWVTVQIIGGTKPKKAEWLILRHRPNF